MSDAAPHEPAAAVPHRAATGPLWIWPMLAVIVIVVGLAGFDRWFYEQVSCRLDTKQNLSDRDFYSVTRYAWVAWRYAFGHLYAPTVLAVLAVIIDTGRWRRYVVALAAVVVVAAAANVLQGTIGRQRPNQAQSHLAFRPLERVLNKEGVSFPSGEATTALAVAVAASALFPRAALLFFAVSGIAAVARLVNGAHYVSDVAAGALLGALGTRTLLRWGERWWGGGLDPVPQKVEADLGVGRRTA